MNRAEVWWIRFEPSVGGEIRKRRPAVIFSNDASKAHLNRLQAVPLSTRVSKIYPSEAKVTLAGRLSDEDMRAVEHAIRIQLGLREGG
jgi:mRNA interferase MazF